MSELRDIEADLRANGGEWVPSKNWHLSAPNIGGMMEFWIGEHQLSLSSDRREAYRRWFESYDPLNLWKPDASGADLGTALDVTVLHTYARANPRILEVGGGYGRIAEWSVKLLGAKHVLLDAVPASLLYAKEYLTGALPDKRIGFYYDGDSYDPTFDVYIAPTWHFETAQKFDACVNIDSFQEMPLVHVNRFIGLFDEHAAKGGVMMIQNYRNLKDSDPTLAGCHDWTYPSGWRHVLSTQTPRSNYPDTPLDVLIREQGDWSAHNALVRAAAKFEAGQRAPLSIVADAKRVGTRALRALKRKI